MAGESRNRISPRRRHIIKRPRLTRILDESNARVLMLVAPAGYGKTTLAREWLEDKRHAWYQGGPASADVAALAAGLADACATIVPGAGERLRARLRATNSPEQDVEPLAELLADDLADWPDDAWLAIDDYQFAVGAPAPEKFIDTLNGVSPVRLFVATRDRPSWVTARRLLYGEVHELSRATLAMNQDEAAQILTAAGREDASGLLALADGWPAVIGLASVASSSLPDDIPNELYDFFAQELYDRLGPELQGSFCQLAAAPTITRAVAQFLFRGEYWALLEAAEGAGILTPEGETYAMHPLLRGFFLGRLADHGVSLTHLGESLVTFYAVENQWDSAFAVLELSGASSRCAQLVEAAFPTLLAEGRLSTLRSWLSYAHEHRVASPTLDLAAAEIAFREGDVGGAEALASRLADLLPAEHQWRTRAFLLAGKAALMANEAEHALGHFQTASATATSDEEAFDATWGCFVAAARLQAPETVALVGDLDARARGIPDRELRRASARMVAGSRMGSIRGLESVYEAAIHLLPRSEDPMIRSSCLVTFAQALALMGHYERALEPVDRAVNETSAYGLDFAQPHAAMVKALIHLGLRQFSQAASLIGTTERSGEERQDVFICMNSASLRARLLLLQGATDLAVGLLSRVWLALPERAMHAEYLAMRALALACSGNSAAACQLADQAAVAGSGIEPEVLSAGARAIAALSSPRGEADSKVKSLVEAADQTGNLDGLLLVCRLSRPVAHLVSQEPDLLNVLTLAIQRAGDHHLARLVGITLPTRSSTATLTRREQEVYELLALGLTNKEIAAALFISEPTAKLHTLHIREKLGLRSRTEVALHASLAGARSQAASATDSSLSQGS